jgi:hypothetical protein
MRLELVIENHIMTIGSHSPKAGADLQPTVGSSAKLIRALCKKSHGMQICTDGGK